MRSITDAIVAPAKVAMGPWWSDAHALLVPQSVYAERIPGALTAIGRVS
jgi:hypothetical protein